MNFGDILEKWENLTPANKVCVKDAAAKDAGAKDAGASDGRHSAAQRRDRLLRKKPDAFIDLHGLTADEAWITLDAFFEDSRRKGLEKVRIIHGKGSHANFTPGIVNESVLRDLSRRFIEACSFAGESGYCQAREGGTGATWVILKEGNGGTRSR